MTSASHAPAKPEFVVRASSRTKCPICGEAITVALSAERDELQWQGRGCEHLRPFDFYRLNDTVFAVYER